MPLPVPEQPAAPCGLPRYANADIQPGGVTIAAGDLVLLDFAGRQPGMTPRSLRPEVFEVERAAYCRPSAWRCRSTASVREVSCGAVAEYVVNAYRQCPHWLWQLRARTCWVQSVAAGLSLRWLLPRLACIAWLAAAAEKQ